jgi:mono/diheme cytochrome c family protein
MTVPGPFDTRWKILVPGLVGLALFFTGVACRGGDTNSADQTELGRQIYQQNCAACHGVRGEGQPNWPVQRPDGSYPAPPHDATGHTWHHSDGLLFRIVKDGGASLNIPNFKSDMPAFGQQLQDEEIRAVINHLKTFWEAEQRERQSQASQNDPFPE